MNSNKVQPYRCFTGTVVFQVLFGVQFFLSMESGALAHPKGSRPLLAQLEDAVDADQLDLEPIGSPSSSDGDVLDKEATPIDERSLTEGNSSSPSERTVASQNGEGVFDEPDLNYEARLYDIYINFNSTAIPAEQWQFIVQGRNTESYSVQQNDTLWGISETIFSDGNFWPKVWSINNSIANPHLIEPGMKIHFLLGDASEPPAFTMTNEEDSAGENSELSAKGEGEQAESVETESEETEEPQDPVKPLVAAETKRRRTNEDLEIPPPDKVSRPVIRKFPPSFPEWQNNFSKGTYDKLGIRIDNRLNLVDSIRVQLVNYVSEEDPESIGEIREVENGGLVASDYQYVYLQVKKSSARLGDKLLVFQNMGPLKQSTEFIEGGASSALTIEVQGIVSLTDIVQSQSSIPGYDLFRALVVKSVNPVGVGSQLRKGEIESVALNSQGDRSNVTAQLIGGPTSAKKQSFYPQSIAYLNRGSKDGLKPGQVLAIRSNRRSRFEGSIVKESFRPSGWLKIAKVTPHLATALVIKISEEISVGDYTGEASGVKSVSSSGTSIDDLSDQALDGFGSNSNEGSADEFGDLPTDDEGEMEEWDGLE